MGVKGVAFVALGAMLLLGVGTAWVVARGAPPGRDTANEMVDSWLAAMAEPTGDRGWSFLSTETQAMIYEDDARAYWNDLEQVDWSRVAWASPGPIRRVGVRDRSGMVASVMWGRENQPLDREVEVTRLGPRQLAVTWRGASCESNTTLVVEGTPQAVRITVQRGLAGGCSGSNVVYDSILELDVDIPIENVEVDLASRDVSEETCSMGLAKSVGSRGSIGRLTDDGQVGRERG